MIGSATRRDSPGPRMECSGWPRCTEIRPNGPVARRVLPGWLIFVNVRHGGFLWRGKGAKFAVFLCTRGRSHHVFRHSADPTSGRAGRHFESKAALVQLAHETADQ